MISTSLYCQSYEISVSADHQLGLVFNDLFFHFSHNNNYSKVSNKNTCY